MWAVLTLVESPLSVGNYRQRKLRQVVALFLYYCINKLEKYFPIVNILMLSFYIHTSHHPSHHYQEKYSVCAKLTLGANTKHVQIIIIKKPLKSALLYHQIFFMTWVPAFLWFQTWAM